jgi:quercetin dioxygenase-like cupin family protein
VTENRKPVVMRPDERPRVEREGGPWTIYLTGRDVGSESIMNGITAFPPGTAIPLHSHDCDESVMIIEGSAVFEDASGQHQLETGDTTFVPAGAVHRFANPHGSLMRILWIYASVDATRTIAATGVTKPVAQDGAA